MLVASVALQENILYFTSFKCPFFMPHSCTDFRSSFNVFSSLLTPQQRSPICFALWKRLCILSSFRGAVRHADANQTSPSVRVKQKRRRYVRQGHSVFTLVCLLFSIQTNVQPFICIGAVFGLVLSLVPESRG